MAQIFHPSFNTLSKVSIFGAVFAVAAAAWAWGRINRSPYVTQEGVAQAQPVPFSHRHHVAGLGIDCRYCHTTVDVAASAGMPSTKTCMSCHSQVWADSPMLEPVRESWRSDRSIEWTRVHDLPDFAYFDHSVHVARGIGCVSCHGRVDQMPLMWRESTLNMEWCLDCHRHPEHHIRPHDRVFDMVWSASPEERAAALRSAAELDTWQLTSCSTCHR
jgi:hypothetical protein